MNGHLRPIDIQGISPIRKKRPKQTEEIKELENKNNTVKPQKYL